MYLWQENRKDARCKTIAAMYHIDIMVSNGLLFREPGIARSFRPANMEIKIPENAECTGVASAGDQQQGAVRMKTRDRVYQFICEFWLRNHYAPNSRDIAAALGLSAHSNIEYHINAMVSNGLLFREPGIARSFRPANMEIKIPENAECTGVASAGDQQQGAVRMKKRDRVYKFICEFWLRNHYAPDSRDIAAALGLSAHSHIEYHINAMVSNGLLFREPGIARSIRPANMEIKIPA